MNSSRVVYGILIVLFLVALIIVFCILLIKLYIKKIKEHNQKELAFQKDLTHAIQETQEQVLSSISRDLHDDAGQQLTAINFQIENLKLDAPEWEQKLQPLSLSVHNLSQSIRAISHALNSNLILKQNLMKAIQTETERLQTTTSKTTIRFESQHPVKKAFTEAEQIIIYRTFQEIINNCLKHAKATELTVSLNANPKFQLEIRDNGIGFNRSEVTSGSLGLLNMEKRAAQINYALSVNTAPGNGTCVTLSEL